GTGEPWIRSHISIGNGIYKSTDAGKSWTHMGLDKTGRIARLIVDPANPQVVLACALGTAYGPQPERGVFRTADGGATWQRTLFVDENTGCSDLTMDPSNPRILLAGMWQIEIKTWGRESGGPGSGRFMARHGGRARGGRGSRSARLCRRSRRRIRGGSTRRSRRATACRGRARTRTAARSGGP